MGTVATTYREAVREAMREALAADDRVFLMGEDIGEHGGAFGVGRGLLEEFGPERVRDAPLSEAAFVGAGIGAAVAGLRPIVEVMTAGFGLPALDRILSHAARFLHSSGGQVAVPIVIRMTGAARRPAAPCAHGLEAWYAHVPGIRVLAPATPADARGMLAPALADPDPVVIFEHGALHDAGGEPATERDRRTDITSAAVRRQGDDVSLITYGGSLPKALAAAERLASDRVSAEVIDLRSLRPLDDATVMASVHHTNHVVVIDEGWRTGSLAAEIAARICEQAFYELDAPVERVCGAEVPTPYARPSEEAALPRVAGIVQAALRTVGRDG